MDMVNSKPVESETAPSSVPVPDVSAKDSIANPVAAAEPAPVPAPVTASVAVAPAAVPAPVEAVKGEIRQTKGTTPGGWNRFAGYNRHDAKNNKQKGPSKRF